MVEEEETEVAEEANGFSDIRSIGIKESIVGQCSRSHFRLRGVEREEVGINISIKIDKIK